MPRPAPADKGSSSGPSKRIISLDQFRGYTVAGMFVVNFLGGYAITHYGLKHNTRFFTWADSIMPGFMLICGVSYRLSVLRRLPLKGAFATYFGIVRRSFGLVLVSLAMYGLGNTFDSWSEVNPESVKRFIAEVIKADLWEVLAIIGMTQILLIPVVARSFRTRVFAFVGLVVLHTFISWWFNEFFVYGKPTWMDEYFFGLEGRRAWDGGCFGLISWAVPMVAGTLVYDVVTAKGAARSVAPLLISGAVLMGVGYGLSCLSTLYDVREGSHVEALESDPQMAASPVVPPFGNASGRPLGDLLAEPPFMPIVGTDQRLINYWMMDKRMPSQSFILFATGFNLVLYVVFIGLCDLGGLAVPLFRTFGTNALAAYAIHHAIELLVQQAVPGDAPFWPVVGAFLVFFFITWMMVRFLEKNKIYLRL